MELKELGTASLKIDKLISKIEFGYIKIPPFQRKFVWQQYQIIDLLDSIYNDYPIGSVLLWNTKEDLPSTRNIGGFILPEKEKEFPVDYVLDGQQRITSIYACFCQSTEQVESTYSAELNLFDIYFDIDEKKFKPKVDLNQSNQSIPIRVLFNNAEFHKICKSIADDDEKFKLATGLQSLFQNYEVPIVVIKGRSKAEVGIIFERINNTGTELTPLDLMIAWTWQEDYHLKEEIEDIIESLSLKGFGEIKDKIILQCLSAIIKNTTVTKEILSLNPTDVRGNTGKLKESLELAIDFISRQFNIYSDDFLPNSHQIVGLTYLFSKINHLTADQSSVLKQWFWRTSFSNRYAGSTDQKMDEDIRFMDEVLSNSFSSLHKYSSLIAEDFPKKQALTKNSPYVRAVLLMLAQQNPLDLTNSNFIDLNATLSSYNRKEYHHVFPKAFLKSQGLQNDKINVVANFCFLPSNSNKKILDKAPADYFFSVIPSNKFDDIVSSNLLPRDQTIYKANDYDHFLNERSELIIQNIKKLTAE